MARLKSPTTIGGAPIRPEGASPGQGLVWNGTEYVPGSGSGGSTILVGTTAPGVGIGSDGDFYINDTTDTMYGPKGGVSLGPETTSQPGAPSQELGSTSYTIGQAYEFTEPATITAIRFWRIFASTTNSRVFKLWNQATSLLIGQTIDTVETGINGWVKADMVAPVDVTAGQIVVASFFCPAAGDGYGYDPPQAMSTSTTTIIRQSHYANADAFPSTTRISNHYVEPVFRVGAAGAVWPVLLQPGGAAAAPGYTHVQASASATWTINHPLGFQPNVVVVDSAGEQVEGEVDYVDGDTITVKFSAAFSGTAYLS